MDDGDKTILSIIIIMLVFGFLFVSISKETKNEELSGITKNPDKTTSSFGVYTFYDIVNDMTGMSYYEVRKYYFKFEIDNGTIIDCELVKEAVRVNIHGFISYVTYDFPVDKTCNITGHYQKNSSVFNVINIETL